MRTNETMQKIQKQFLQTDFLAHPAYNRNVGFFVLNSPNFAMLFSKPDFRQETALFCKGFVTA